MMKSCRCFSWIVLAIAILALVPILASHLEFVLSWWTTNAFVAQYGLRILYACLVMGSILLLHWYGCATVRRCDNADAAMRRENRMNMLNVEKDESWKDGVQDELNRKAYVSFVANLICGLPGWDSACIGMYGKWGEGKSFVWDMIKSRIAENDQDVELVEFRPWQHGSRSEWGSLLFDCISKVLARHGCRSALLVMRDYGRSLGIRPAFGLLGGIPVIGGWLDGRVSELFDSSRLHDQAVKTLESFGRRIVVVIEDLDRLEYDDVCEIIRVIKSNGALPNILYVLLADENHLVKALARKFGDAAEGRKYLKKIVAFPCPLPDVSESDLASLYLSRVKRYLTERHQMVIEDGGLRKLAMLSGMFLCIRDVIRSYNQFVLDYEFQIAKSGDHSLNVDCVDLAGLSVVKALENGLYSNLRNIYHFLASIRDVKAAAKAYDETWMNDRVLGRVTVARRSAVKVFLESFMGIHFVRIPNPNGPQFSYYTIEDSAHGALLARHSLMSKCCLDDYFTSQCCLTSVPSGDQQKFLSCACVDPDGALEVVRKIASEGRLPYLIQILLEWRTPSESDELISYLATLMMIADRAWPEGQLRIPRDLDSHSVADIYGKIHSVVINSLHDKKKSGADVLVPEYIAALSRSHGFEVALQMFEKWWSDDASYTFYTKGHELEKGFGDALELALINVAEAAEKGMLYKHPHAKDLVDGWARLVCHCEDEGPVVAFRKWYEKSCSVSEAVPAWVLQSCEDPFWGWNGNKISWTLDFDRFEATLGCELTTFAMYQLQSLRDRKQLDERDARLVECLEFASVQKASGLPYDQRAQVEAVYKITCS